MVAAPIFMYLVALIGLLFMAAGGFSATTLVVGIFLIWILERELFQIRLFSEGDDASDEPHHVHHH
jgi:hypothetical protein